MTYYTNKQAQNKNITSRFLLAVSIVSLALCCLYLSASASLAANSETEYEVSRPAEDGKVRFKINQTELHVAYAATPLDRQLGLMYRRSMCDDCGMLFKFDSARIGSIWMKNTFIPLDLAYIDANGEIVGIYQLVPHDLTPVKSPSKVLYALEMNRGWFAKQNIRVGDIATSLP